MDSRPSYGPIAGEAEESAYRDLALQAFGMAAKRWPTYRDRVGRENMRVWRRGERVVGGLSVYPGGQWFGGRSVPMAAVAAVAVVPEVRAVGVARGMMAAMLREERERGVPLSTLYASTQHLYRRVGYEQAGARPEYLLPTTGLRPLDRETPVSQIDPKEHRLLHDLYRERARSCDGHLDRHPCMWERTVHSEEAEPLYGYRIGPSDAPQGYLLYTQKWGSDGLEIHVRDWAAGSTASMRRFLTFLADLRSLARTVHLLASPVEPLFGLLDEQREQPRRSERWLLRIVDLKGALEQRGYPGGAKGELHLEVVDEILPENSGRFVLEVGQGTGAARPGGRGSLRASIQALAPLYSGFFSPWELRRLGWLEGDDAAVEAAGAIFAGPTPWMPDAF